MRVETTIKTVERVAGTQLVVVLRGGQKLIYCGGKLPYWQVGQSVVFDGTMIVPLLKK